jgi:hypothetical protein
MNNEIEVLKQFFAALNRKTCTAYQRILTRRLCASSPRAFRQPVPIVVSWKSKSTLPSYAASSSASAKLAIAGGASATRVVVASGDRSRPLGLYRQRLRLQRSDVCCP